MSGLHELTALEAAAAARRREVCPVELVEHAVDRIARLDADLGAFVTVTADVARGRPGRPSGSCAAPRTRLRCRRCSAFRPRIKDPNLTKGVATKFGSRLFADFVPEVDDYVAELLRAAGTISLGKTAAPEFGLPCYTETDIGPRARTPWDTARLAGGSSGEPPPRSPPASSRLQGSDGGGSIRYRPASGAWWG